MRKAAPNDKNHYDPLNVKKPMLCVAIPGFFVHIFPFTLQSLDVVWLLHSLLIGTFVGSMVVVYSLMREQSHSINLTKASSLNVEAK